VAPCEVGPPGSQTIIITTVAMMTTAPRIHGVMSRPSRVTELKRSRQLVIGPLGLQDGNNRKSMNVPLSYAAGHRLFVRFHTGRQYRGVCIPVEITQVSVEDLKRLAEEQGLTLAAYAFI